MQDQTLLRYTRQIMLPEIDIEGQQKLLHSHVLILGLGGLGSLASMYLASAGIGTLTLVDFDIVNLSNLQRQLIHQTQDIGRLKVDSAKDTLNALNPEIKIQCLSKKMSADELHGYLAGVDLVVDCSDNFTTRYALNALCVKQAIPLVSGSAIGFEGQISVFDTKKNHSPCYQCLYPDVSQQASNTCAENGVLGPVVGVIACMQALEAIKTLLNIGDNLLGSLLIFDGLNSEWRKLKLKRDPHCPVCNSRQYQHE